MLQGDAWCHPDTEQPWGDGCVPQEVLGCPGEMLGFLMEASAYSREVFGCPGEILWCSKVVLVCPVDRVCNEQGRSLGAFGKCRGDVD